MIIVKIKAGLGNQMFQYACGRALALRNKTELKLDVSDWTLNKEKVREYLLPKFNIRAGTASDQELRQFKYPWGELLGKVIRKLRYKSGRVNIAFDPKIFALKDDEYLDGYWQSEKYFSDFCDEIREELTLRDPLGDQAQNILDKISSSSISISLQIRRGDNAHSPASMKSFGCPGIEYYNDAIGQLIKELGIKQNQSELIHVFVFSDDIEWAKTNLHTGFPTTFVSRNDIQLCEEIPLMKACKHNIISNSTFGWWGAWLNRNDEKIVIAPKQWALLHVEKYKDLIPEQWIRI